jgi:hypothetical protein
LRRNCFLKDIIEGNVKGRIEVRGGGRAIGRKQLLDVFKRKRGYCKLIYETLDGSVWRAGFATACEPVVRQTTVLMNEGSFEALRA